MLHITKCSEAAKFAMVSLPPPCEISRDELPPIPLPQISDPSKVPFDAWRSMYREYLEKMFHYFTNCMSSEVNEQGNVFKYTADARSSFERMVYETSENADKAYVFFK